MKKFLTLSIFLLSFQSSAFAMMLSPEEENPSGTQNVLLKHIDLRQEEILKPLLSDHFQDDESVSKALEIVKSVYESNPRFVGGKKYGMAFPMHPEVLHYLMTVSKDKEDEIGLEIAGAGGENSILLAFSGLGKVYLNDIDDDEIDNFKTTKNTLPIDLRSRLESIHGSVFNILEQKPELINRVGLVVCRNFLHFLTDTQHSELFNNILKPITNEEANISITLNSAYNLNIFKPLLQDYPEATRFQVTRCLLTIFGHNNDMPCHCFFEKASVCHEDLDPLAFTNRPIYEIENYQCAPNISNIMKYDEDTQTQISNTITSNSLGSFSDGRISIITNIMRVYTLNTLPKLCEEYGLQVETKFLIAKNGHIVTPDDVWAGEQSERAQQVGVIARWKK